MGMGFGSLPAEVTEYVRATFSRANDKASATLTLHPSMHEEGLDQLFVAELSATPATFFASSNAAVLLETHWLGGRWMYHRWEVADIAVFVSVTTQGQLVAQKVALLQTKRLYSQQLAGTELERTDFEIGIGRLVQRANPRFPMSSQRPFGFTVASRYGALESASDQVHHIDAYTEDTTIPVYYGLYNPMTIPYSGLYPATATPALPTRNAIGCRVIPASSLHGVLGTLPTGQSPTHTQLTFNVPFDAKDTTSAVGWRIENFIADEVLTCKQGARFAPEGDPNLQRLLYARGAPIAAAIAITIDFGSGGE